jgi:kynureninase
MDSTKIANGKIVFPPEAITEEYARLLDSQDPLRSFRDKFIIPTKTSMKAKEIHQPGLFTPLFSELSETETTDRY